MIQHAKEQCDYLIVGVNADNLVENYKHKTPVVKEDDRVEIVSSISAVNECMVVKTLDKLDAHKKFHFNTIFIGDDWKGNPRWERTIIDMDKLGVDLVFIPYTNGIFSSVLKELIT